MIMRCDNPVTLKRQNPRTRQPKRHRCTLNRRVACRVRDGVERADVYVALLFSSDRTDMLVGRGVDEVPVHTVDKCGGRE